jgi:tetratricopeptide (TPR) repeat protein
MIVAAFVRSELAYGQALTPVSVEVSHIGDTSHLELKGRTNWTYNVRRETHGKNTTVVLTTPALDAKSVIALKSWSSPLIENVTVDDHGPDGQMLISFALKNKDAQTFDYQTDQPSRLVVDFFVQSQPVTAVVKTDASRQTIAQSPKKSRSNKVGFDVVTGKDGISKIFKIRASESDRAPASADFMLSAGDEPEESEAQLGEDFKHGIFDGADPNFDRFRVKDYEIKESAVIASQQNIYLRFPILKLESKTLANIQDNPPIYEVTPDLGEENKQAQFLKTLFERKRYAVFQKTLKLFDKKFPKSRYREMLHYMSADIQYAAWNENQKPEDFDKAMSGYRDMITAYPDSPLAERTTLLVGLSYLQRGDYVSTLREFQRYIANHPNAPFLDQAKVAIAEAYTGLGKYDEALTTLRDLQATAQKPKYQVEAAYRMGDVAFQNHDYAAAAELYHQALQKYPDAWKGYPNSYFNAGESQFWVGQYKDSLDTFREYLRRFPGQEYGGYALTRVAELFEILGVDQRRVMGAFLESYFRYGTTPGGRVARLRLISQRLKNMKPKEMEKAVAEVEQITKESTLPEMSEFATVVLADGLFSRGEYDSAIDRLIHFYQSNPSSKNLSFIKNRIVRSVTQKIKNMSDKGDFIGALSAYSHYEDTWLKGADRVDVRYSVGRAYEQAGVFKEAANVYRESLNKIYSFAGTPLEKQRNAFEQLPSPDTLNLRLASVSLHEGEYAHASDYLKQIHSSDKLSEPEQIERVEIGADVAEKTGHSKEAIHYLTQLVETWSGKPQLVASPLLKIAELATKIGDHAKAQAALTHIIDMQTDTHLVAEDVHAKALEMRGDLFLKEKKSKEAMDSYAALLEAYEKTRPLAFVRYRLGELQFRRGDAKDAETTWAPLEGASNKIWFQMAQEQLHNDQFHSEYKKYINRIPAMADRKEGAN